MQYPEFLLARSKEDLGRARDAGFYLADLNLNELSNIPVTGAERESGKMNLERMIRGWSGTADQKDR